MIALVKKEACAHPFLLLLLNRARKVATGAALRVCCCFLREEPRVHGSWMPVLRLVNYSTTCSDLYTAVESAFFTCAHPSDSASEAYSSSPVMSHAEEHVQQKSKISGVFTQAVEAINKTFGPANADPTLRKWRLQVVSGYTRELVDVRAMQRNSLFTYDCTTSH